MPGISRGMTAALAAGGCLIVGVGALAVSRARGAGGGAVAAAGAAAESLLVSPSWLLRHLNDPSLVVVHAGMSRARYDEGHVSGARYLAFSSYVTNAPSGTSHGLPPAERLRAALEEIGVSDGSRVVIYGDLMAATRLFFTLDYLGLAGRAAILDGGLDAWRAAGGAVAPGPPARVARGTLAARPRRELVADAGAIAADIGRSGVALVDARERHFYESRLRLGAGSERVTFPAREACLPPRSPPTEAS